MIEFVLGLVIGLIVGWNFLPQPTFVKTYVENIWDFIKSKLMG